jgi:hypothetical protein
MSYDMSMPNFYFFKKTSTICLTKSDLVTLVLWASLVNSMNCLVGMRTVSICSLFWLVLILVVFIWWDGGRAKM